MGMSTSGGGGTRQPMSEINVTPFVDVMLVLLIIFMVATPLIKKEESDQNREVELDLPVTEDNPNTVDPSKVKDLLLEIDRDLRVRLGEVVIADCSEMKSGSEVSRFEPCFQSVGRALGANEKLKEDGTIYLLADTEIPYGFVVGVMNRIKLAGVSNVGMVTNPEYLDK
jgi:biopolymer transport protein TolR